MRANCGSRRANVPVLASFAGMLLAGLAGCHAIPVPPTTVAPVQPGTVRILGAVALPQVATIPPSGLTLGGALELAGGLASDLENSATPAVGIPAPTPTPATAQPVTTAPVVTPPVAPAVPENPLAGPTGPNLHPTLPNVATSPVANVPKPDARNSQNADANDGQLLVGLRRIVNGVPHTTYFAVPLVRKYLAGTIPLEDGDQVRVVNYKSTRFRADKPLYPKPTAGEPPPQITVFAGTLSDSSVVFLQPGGEAQSYDTIREKFLSKVDQSAFGTMNSLTKINPNDGGVETYVIPNNTDPVAFPQFDSAILSDMKVQDGDTFGLTTLPQVPAISIPAITAAKDSLIDAIRASRTVAAPAESRLRRTVNALGRGQLPTVAPVSVSTLPTVQPLPRSLNLPSRGAIADRLQQHKDQKHSSHLLPVDATIVPASASIAMPVMPSLPVAK